MVSDVDVQAAVRRYMELPYRVELVPDEAGWFVSMPDLPGCMSQGRTVDEAMEMIREAQELWLEGAVEKGLTIPIPGSQEQYNGRILVRVPKDIHRDLARVAERQGVSMNLFVASALARAVGRVER